MDTVTTEPAHYMSVDMVAFLPESWKPRLGTLLSRDKNKIMGKKYLILLPETVASKILISNQIYNMQMSLKDHAL